MKAVLSKQYQYFKRINRTFNVSNSFQEYTVPTGCTSLNVDCVASKGNNGTGTAGKGGRVQCTLTVTPGQTLYFYIGATNSVNSTAEYNASDIRTDNTGVTDGTSLNSRLLVAGGGGSGANLPNSSNSWGGNGGGTTGAYGGYGSTGDYGGSGGSQSAGGAGRSGGSTGSFGLGGNGGRPSGSTYLGGAGGGGWYGGGGGGGSTNFKTLSGGGGGSSYTSASCSNVVHTQGFQDGNGYITITGSYNGTEQDHDYAIETIVAKVIKQSDKLYAVKSYNKGEYFGE